MFVSKSLFVNNPKFSISKFPYCISSKKITCPFETIFTLLKVIFGSKVPSGIIQNVLELAPDAKFLHFAFLE